MTRRLLTALALLLPVAAAPPADEPANLDADRAIAKLAADLASVLGGDKPTVRLGTVVVDKKGDAARRGNPVPELVRQLTSELLKAGVKIDPESNFSLDCAYFEAEPTNSPMQLLALDFRLTDTKANKTMDLPVRVTNQPSVARLLALPFQYPANAGADEQYQTLKTEVDKHIPDSKVKPQATLKGTLVLAAPDSPFAVEILAPGPADAPALAALTPFDEAGLAFVKLDRARPFAVRLVNRAEYEAAVELSIDGLKLFVACDPDQRGKDSAPLYNFVAVPPRQGDKPGTLVVEGWFLNPTKSAPFKPDALPLDLKCGKLGVVNARFHASVPKDKDLPPGEPANASELSFCADARDRSDIPTEAGPSPRKIGQMRANVAVRFSRE